MSLILRKDICENCKFGTPDDSPEGAQQGLFICHRFPPQQTYVGVGIPVKRPDGRGGTKEGIQVEIRRMASPPQVPRSFWCGEHKPALIKVSEMT